jgi:hypothetical protein
MDQSKLMRQWTFKSTSPLIRFYRWGYTDDISKLTFCKLFWSCTLVAPFAILLHLVSALLPERKPRKEKTLEELIADRERRIQKKSRDTRAKRWATSFANWAADAGDHLAAFFQRIGDFFRRQPWIGTCTKTFGVSCLIGACGFVVYAIAYGIDFWIIHSFGTMKLAGFVLILVIAGVGILYFTTNWLMNHIRVLEWIGEKVFGILEVILDFFCGVGRFFAAGYHAIKYRTCPRIEVTGEETDASFA